MHDVSGLWREIFAEPNHRKEVMVKVNGVEYHEDRILYTPPSVVGKLFDAPSVGNARARTLTLNLMPYDGPQGRIPPMSEILLFVRLKSADGGRVSEYIQKGVFYADEVRRDSVTGATRITAFDAMMKMERQFGNAVCRITFDDGFGGIQRFVREIGDAMPAPDAPAHEGERFLAWYPNPANTQTVTRDMLFTANWAQKFTVTFDSGSGTPQTFSVFNGDATPTPTTPTKSGYLFTGWTPTPAASVTADATHTAQWASVTGIVITAYPAKMTYELGETLDYAGLSVTMTYSNGATRDVTADCSLSPVAGTEVIKSGTITVTVSYDSETAAIFDVTGKSAVAGGDWWTVRNNGLLDIYCVGDIPDYSPYSYEILAHYHDGTAYNWAYEDGSTAPWDVYAHEVWHYTGQPEYGEKEIVIIRQSMVNAISIRDSVTGIGTWAFAGVHLQSNLVIPNSVAKIGDYAFSRAKDLTSVVIPGSVAEIGDYAFYGCDSLTSVVIPDSVTEIGGYAFNGTGLREVTISRNCAIGYQSFPYGCIINYY